MNNPELMQEAAAGEGYIAPTAKRPVASNS